MSTENSFVVVGDGWAALGLTGFLAQAKKSVTWITGSGARIVSPLPVLETGFEEQGAQAWARLVSAFSLDVGALTSGSFTREFRNKAFREPTWMKAPTPEDRREARNELLWAPERILAPVFEARFQLTLAEIDGLIREKLSAMENVRRIEGVPVQALQISNQKIEGITLASGETIACEQVFFADRWAGLGQIEGLPKALPFTRKREPMGLLQAVFTHEQPAAIGVQEGFFGAIAREAGEETERHVWGHFSSDGMKSYWTVCLSSEETEDNHAIAKKLRRAKNSLDKMFTGTAWVPEGKTDFLSNVRSEQVRFEEAILFSEGEDPREPITLDRLSGICFLTDGYGPTSALRQVNAALNMAGVEVPAATSPSVESSASI